MKTCSCCGAIKSFTEFHKCERGIGGVRGDCIVCFRLKAAIRHRKKPSIMRARVAEWKKNNKQKVNNQLKKYRDANKGKVAFAIKRWGMKHPEKALAKTGKYVL